MRRVTFVLVISGRLALYLLALAVVVATRPGHQPHGPGSVRLAHQTVVEPGHPGWLYPALLAFIGLGIALELLSGAARWR